MAVHLLAGDREWLAENYPKMRRGAQWQVRAIQREKERLGSPDAVGYGLLPIASGESGGVGHNYYVNSFAVLGLNMAAEAARAAGDTDSEQHFRQNAADVRAIRAGFCRFNDFAGTIPTHPEWLPPAKEGGPLPVARGRPYTNFGCALVWPTDAVAPFDPLMNAWCRHHEREAETTGGLFDWLYIQADWGLSYIRHDEPDRAADYFYVYMDNASGCLNWGENNFVDSPFPEFDPPRKGIRTAGQMPHGWASAMFISFLRNLMLNEE